MSRKNTRFLCVLLVLMSCLVGFIACGIHGDPHENIPPTIRITSFTGFDWEDGEGWSPDLAPFQQTIYWAADDADGVVVGYAYRVLDGEGKPIPTPGNISIDEIGELTPDGLRDMIYNLSLGHELNGKRLGNGWIIHHSKGADQTIPLDDPNADRTIWTDRVFAIINFPAHDGSYGDHGNLPVDSEGNLIPIPSRFEVVAIDNRGGISQPAVRYFNSKSVAPSLHISSSSGTLNDKEIGQGVRVIFMKQDVLIDGVVSVRAWYYIYKLRVIEIPHSIGGIPLSSTERDTLDAWMNYHKNHPVNPWPDIWDVFLRENPPISESNEYNTRENIRVNETVISTTESPSSPALTINVRDGVRMHGTVIETRVVDLAGVVSEPTYALFYVSDKFKPHALFYYTHSYAMGDDFFILDQSKDNVNVDLVPFSYTSTGIRMASTLTASPILNSEGRPIDFEWAIVGDAQTRFWFRWGYHGEYKDDDPNDLWYGVVRDPENEEASGLGTNYLTEVVYYYIQLNGQRYDFGPLNQPGLQPNGIMFPEGDSFDNWLRIPANHEISQRLSFNGLTSTNGINGTDIHEFKVMIEDLQSVRSTPAIYRFRIVEKTTDVDREGVLYINNQTSIPNGIFDFYRDVLPNNMPITTVDRIAITSLIESIKLYDIDSYYNLRTGRHIFPYSFLSKYKYVIYAAESSPVNTPLSMNADQDGFRMYMQNHGNLIIVGNLNLAEQINAQLDAPMNNFYQQFFGWPNARAEMLALNESLQGRQYYLLGTTPTGSQAFPILNAELVSPADQVIGNFITTRQGLGVATVFYSLADTAEPIYLFRSKTVDGGDWSPLDEADRARFHDQIIAFRKMNGQGYGYTLGFQPFHMNRDNIRALFAEIMR
ncbi:MAG: hypothetical protein FWG98_00480 [Candidatus Cloacimonetes bacterium]|nr:hypothetical protein [Candidatus Cloacimonadota bacterium]